MASAIRPERYVYPAPATVIAGEPVADVLAREAGRRGAERVVVFANRTLSQRCTLAADLKGRLAGRLATVAPVAAAPVTAAHAIAAANIARAAAADMIVAIGSGGLIETVKLVLLCLAENIGDAETLATFRGRAGPAGGPMAFPPIRPLPLRPLVVPTTLAAAQFTDFTDCAFDGARHHFHVPGAAAETLVLDPWLALATPPATWLASGMKALDHAVESVCSIAPVSLVDATCLQALSLIAPALRRTRRDPTDVVARHDGLRAMWLAGAGMGGRVPVGASHGFAHVLTALAGLSHGATTGTILPAVLRYNQSANAEAQARCAAALGAAGTALADVVATLVDDLGLPGSLSAAGVRKNDLARIAEAAVGHFMMRSNPRPILSTGDALAILNDAW